MYGFITCYGNRLFQRYYFCPVVCRCVKKQQPIEVMPEQVPFKGGKG